MNTAEWLAVGVFIGTGVGYVLSKKKDFRTGLSVGIGLATMIFAFVSRIF